MRLGWGWTGWQRSAAIRKRRSGWRAAIHTLFLAQAPQNLPFESFQYLYMALDACYSLVAARQPRPPRVPHAARIKWLCSQFGLTVPAWADPASDGVSLSASRNDAFHEALFFGEPLGFALFKEGPKPLRQVPACPTRRYGVFWQTLVPGSATLGAWTSEQGASRNRRQTYANNGFL